MSGGVISKRSQQVDEFDFELRTSAAKTIAAAAKRLHTSSQQLQALDLRLRFARAHTKLAAAESRLLQLSRGALWKAQHAYEPLKAHLKQLSPLAVLGRGYAIVQNSQGRVIRKAVETAEGANVRILLHEGKLGATVDIVDPN